MKIKLLSLAALLVAALGLSGCYDVSPGGYGYGGYGPSYAASEPWYGGGYYPGGWGNWGGWGYPAYYGHPYWHHDWDHDGWNHGGWDHNHYVVPEHGGFVGHNFGAPMGGGRGFAVAHNNAYRGGGGWHGGGGGWHGGGGGWHGGGGGSFHGAARGASRGGGNSHANRR